MDRAIAEGAWLAQPQQAAVPRVGPLRPQPWPVILRRWLCVSPGMSSHPSPPGTPMDEPSRTLRQSRMTATYLVLKRRASSA
jgi:hypothetical protein